MFVNTVDTTSAMDPETSNNTSDSTTNDERVHFSHVTAVAFGWIFDYSFVSLCRYFKESQLSEFNATLTTFQNIVHSGSLTTKQKQKRKIAALLARILSGKELDVVFEDDERVMPLMSATTIWISLRNTVEDDVLFERIASLLFVQAVAVCLAQGQRSMASSALKWLNEKHDIPQNLLLKLTAMLTKGDIYHPFFLNFSFGCLLENVQVYIDAFLTENPSNFLLQAATKVVLSSQYKEQSEDSSPQEQTHLEKTTDYPTADLLDIKEEIKSKRKLLSTRNLLWKPESCKKSHFTCKRSSENEVPHQRALSEKSLNTTDVRRTKRKWTSEMDSFLKAGVMRHGEGKWSRILLDYDFEGRTGTMLKDRWRFLKKSFLVS